MKRAGKKSSSDVVRGMLAGMVGGLAGSCAMVLYMEAVSKAVNGDRPPQGDNVTEKVADLAMRTMTREEPSEQAKQTGGAIVHYGFGTIVGAVYGAAVEYLPFANSGFGTLYGTTLFVVADEFSLPQLELAHWPADESVLDQLGHLGAHLVYGVATEVVRRAVCACL